MRHLAPRTDPFRIEIRPDGEGVGVTPIGELDLATVPVLDEQLQHLLDDGDFRSISVDLRRLTFMDTAGVHLFLAWRDEAAVDLTFIQGSVARHVLEAADVPDGLASRA